MKRCISLREEEEFMTCVEITDCVEGFVVAVVAVVLLLMLLCGLI